MTPVPSAALGLPRARRIKQGRDFARARTQGRRVVSGCLIVNWLALPASAPARLGVITGRKIGAAVARRRARRLLREAFRLNQLRLPQPPHLVPVAPPPIHGKRLAGGDKD